MVKQPWFVLPQISSLLVHWVKHMLQNLLVVLLIDDLTLWQELNGDDAPHIKEYDQLTCFLQPWQHQKFPFMALSPGFWIILKNLCLVTEASLIQFEHTHWSLDTPRCSGSSVNYSTVPLVIIFQTLLFHVQLTCHHLKSQPMIATHHSPACWRSPTTRIISHLLVLLFKPLVPTQKHVHNICYLHTLAEAFQVLVMKYSPNGPKISGLFFAWCSLFIPQCS